MPGEPCLYCGREPTATVDLRAHTGMVVLARYSVIKGSFCRDCGMGLFRNRMNHTLLLGWWGVIAFFFNFYAVGKNLVSWYRLTNLAQPRGVPRVEPVPMGRPVYARPGLWAVVGLFLALNVLLDSAGGPEDITGRCVNLGRSGMHLVTCDDIHDGRVLNMATSSVSCAAGADEAIQLRREGGPSIACVDLDR